MSEINRQKSNKIMWFTLIVHAGILFFISFFLPAAPSSTVGFMVFNLFSQTLGITTQISSSPYPFVSIVTSAYAVFTSVIILFALFYDMKKSVPTSDLKTLLKARFFDQLDLWIGFRDLLKSLAVIVVGLLLAWFHLYWLDDAPQGGRGDIYLLAFDSRLGIFIVQWIFTFWLVGIYSVCLVLWLQFDKWVEQED